MWRKLTAAATVAVGLAIGASAPVDASNRPDRTETTVVVNWSISSANCSELPPGETVEGSGPVTNVTTTRVDKHGVVHIRQDAHSEGTATDLAGNEYAFRYDNVSHISNSLTAPNEFNGVMVDRFSLRGAGPSALANGFTARFFLNVATGEFAIDPIQAQGDPFAFPSGGGRCDPL